MATRPDWREVAASAIERIVGATDKGKGIFLSSDECHCLAMTQLRSIAQTCRDELERENAEAELKRLDAEGEASGKGRGARRRRKGAEDPKT